MTLVRVTSLGEAVDALDRLPGAVVLAGGTELVPSGAASAAEHLVSLRSIPGMRGVEPGAPGEVVIGALTTYSDLAAGAGAVPLLTSLAPTVGSPASRNAGTVGGALGTASGAGDLVTGLLALDAVVVVEARAGRRRVPVAAWLDGSGREPADVVAAVAVPRPTGPQAWLKAGERSAVFYATASCALVVDRAGRAVRCATGSVGPLPVRAGEAEALAARELLWDGPFGAPGAAPGLCRRFGDAVAAALPDPPDGLRVSGAHRRVVAGVLAARALARVTA